MLHYVRRGPADLDAGGVVPPELLREEGRRQDLLGDRRDARRAAAAHRAVSRQPQQLTRLLDHFFLN